MDQPCPGILAEVVGAREGGFRRRPGWGVLRMQMQIEDPAGARPKDRDKIGVAAQNRGRLYSHNYFKNRDIGRIGLEIRPDGTGKRISRCIFGTKKVLI